MEFSKRLDLFQDEIFASLQKKSIELEQEGRTLYNMYIGTPDFPVQEHIRSALMEAAADPENWKYSLRDTPELQSAVVDYYQSRFGVTITPDMIQSCFGSQEGMGHIGFALINEGDTVLLPTPCYPVFIAGTKLAGGVPYYYPLSEETNFLPSPPEPRRRSPLRPVSRSLHKRTETGTPCSPASGSSPQHPRHSPET